MKVKVGLYGNNGHQIQSLLIDNPLAELVATASFDLQQLLPSQKADYRIKHFNTLEEMLQDDEIQLISLCSPRRREQAEDAVSCLMAGKHVYAEKPCAMSEVELDRIIETVRITGCKFHEMAGTAFEQPYIAIKEIVEQGFIGEVVQVFAQKSYPYFDQRPQNEDIDGGLICQNGIHAFRFIEHVALQKIKEVYAIETSIGNPVSCGGLQMAASCTMFLENGGVANVVCNYLNQSGFGLWGNEHLRIFGTKGFVESVDGGVKTRLVIGDKDFGEIKQEKSIVNYFNIYLDSLITGDEMPLTLADELHPTRMAIRAKKSAINFNYFTEKNSEVITKCQT